MQNLSKNLGMNTQKGLGLSCVYGRLGIGKQKQKKNVKK